MPTVHTGRGTSPNQMPAVVARRMRSYSASTSLGGPLRIQHQVAVSTTMTVRREKPRLPIRRTRRAGDAIPRRPLAKAPRLWWSSSSIPAARSRCKTGEAASALMCRPYRRWFRRGVLTYCSTIRLKPILSVSWSRAR